jgi:hypothetical protein
MMHLVIPDPHAHPDYDNKRFEYLGKLILDLKPDKVICLGDMADLPSLCSYDKGTQGFEGRRYKDDVNATIDAQEKLFAPLKKAKKRKPKMYMLEGNHEHRISRAISTDAAHLDGIISLDDLHYKKFGWEFIPYRGATPGIKVIDGVAYAHYHTSGVMGRAISGEHPAYSLLVKQYQSCTSGHLHTLDYATRTKADGSRIQGLMAGVFSDYFADFAGEANELWWRGVIVKRNVVDGNYDPEFISIDRMKKEYK